MKKTISAVMYSPNLGDGVIADCISWAALSTNSVDITPNRMDIAGRNKFVIPGKPGKRALILNMLETLPKFVSERCVQIIFPYVFNRKIKPVWNKTLEGTTGLILGGGQIFADTHLNFPLKIAEAARAANERNLPIAIHGVGVSKVWSKKGRALFAEAINNKNIKAINVRDQASKDNLKNHFMDLGLLNHLEINIAPDPGVLAEKVYGRSKRANISPLPHIGLGITHPVAIKSHSDSKIRLMLHGYEERVISLIGKLLRANFKVSLFTNGSGEDVLFANKINNKISALGVKFEGVALCKRSATPADLGKLISTCDVIIAHRLHANILAYSYKVPHIGLTWDTKLNQFFELIEREKYIGDGLLFDLDGLVLRANEALNDPIAPTHHKKLQTDALNGIKATFNSLN